MYPPLEGGPFRLSELIVFEALFRLVGNDLDGTPTRAISKGRLCSFWNKGIALCNVSTSNSSSGVLLSGSPPSANDISQQMLLTERDLTLLCRNPDTVTFQEFMFIVRNKLASRVACQFLMGKPELVDPSLFPAPEKELPEGCFAYIVCAFVVLSRALRVYRSGLQSLSQGSNATSMTSTTRTGEDSAGSAVDKKKGRDSRHSPQGHRRQVCCNF
jgi:hypothetical protein